MRNVTALAPHAARMSVANAIDCANITAVLGGRFKWVHSVSSQRIQIYLKATVGTRNRTRKSERYVTSAYY